MSERMRITVIMCLFLLTPGDIFSAPRTDNVDRLTTTYITPVRIVWTAGEILDQEELLKEFSGQVSVSSDKYASFINRPGSEKSSILLDFGKEYQGGIEIAAAIRDSQKPLHVRVRLGESVSEAMSEGDTTATNDHAMRDMIVPVPWLGTIKVGESGFRFVRIDLLEEDAVLNVSAVRTVFRYRDIPYLGTFTSDDPRLDEIYTTGAYTVHLNMQNFLWDGIKRDRLVWLGDMHPEVMCINNVFGDNEVIRKSLDFARDDTPLPGWINNMCSYSLWWIIIHKDYYMYTGDRPYLDEQLPYLRELVKQVLDNIKGNRENFSGGIRFLDWPTSEMPEVIHAGLQSLAILGLEAAAQIGEWTGDTDLTARCTAAVGNLRRFTPSHSGNKQAAAMLSLAGLLDAGEAASVISDKGASGFSTFYGYYMLESLAGAGMYDMALDIISDYWGGMLDLGATTFWEDFTYEDLARASRIDEIVPEGAYDIHAHGGAYCYEGLRHSFCHGWAAGPTSWLTKYVLGVTPLEAGCTVIGIKPNLGRLKRVKGSFPTPAGLVNIEHVRLEDGTIDSKVEAPDKVKVVMHY